MAKIRHFIPEKPNINLITAKTFKLLLTIESALIYCLCTVYNSYNPDNWFGVSPGSRNCRTMSDMHDIERPIGLAVYRHIGSLRSGIYMSIFSGQNNII